MCGFAMSLLPDDPWLMKAAAAISHRGTLPPRVTRHSAFARLPIVGSFEQPITIFDEEFCFVGELLNFRDFTDELGDTMLAFRTLRDFGVRGFQGFDGFWSVAYHRHGRITLIADYLAQKPIFYTHSRACSELWPLVEEGEDFDEVFLSDVMKWGYCPDQSRTPFTRIKKVLPGHSVSLPERQMEHADPVFIADDYSPEALKYAFEEAVRLRVQSSDVPVACLLSGGYDSSLVYRTAREYGDIVPYHIGLTGELGVAQSIAGPSLRVVPTAAPPTDLEILLWMQEPVDLGSVEAQILMAEAVKENVCLGGDGADEFFGGYGRAARYDSRYSDVFHELVCYHLPRLDRVMMRKAVEYRSPFLSRRMAQLALAAPYAPNKKILRDIWPNDVEKKPLRPAGFDREAHSIRLVKLFREIWL